MTPPSPALPSPRLCQVLAGQTLSPPPVWFMRQAGRYLPEYRALRTRAASFLDFCYTPDLAIEATLQPLRRFDLDAAIVFSDILIIPDALGQAVSFETGEGPRLDPIQNLADLNRLKPRLDLEKLRPVFETLRGVRSHLSPEKALIGFCGAPWTLACYMVGGQSRPDQAPARLAAYQDPIFFAALMDRLCQACADLLIESVRAGAQLLQIFDSWAGVLAPLAFEDWSLAPLVRVIRLVQEAEPHVPIIVFVRTASETHLTRLVEVAQDLPSLRGVSLETSLSPQAAATRIPASLAIQGNLDPLALVAGGAVLERAIQTICQAFADRPFIFNLGHGIVPQTPPDHVALALSLVRNHRFRMAGDK